jgi:hypothetical protein
MPSGEASRTALLEFEMGALPELTSDLNHASLINKVKAGETLEYVEKMSAESVIAEPAPEDIAREAKPSWAVPEVKPLANTAEMVTAPAEKSFAEKQFFSDVRPTAIPTHQKTAGEIKFEQRHPEFKEPVTSEEIEEWEALHERRGSEIDNFRWVANNMEFTADVKTCPSPAAWGILKQCKTDPNFKRTFWTTMYTKLVPTRSKLDGNSEKRGEGEDEITLLNEIANASQDAKEGL